VLSSTPTQTPTILTQTPPPPAASALPSCQLTKAWAPRWGNRPPLPHPTVSSSTSMCTFTGPSNPRAVCPDHVCPKSLPRPWVAFVQPPALTLALSDLAGHPSTPHHRAKKEVHCNSSFTRQSPL